MKETFFLKLVLMLIKKILSRSSHSKEDLEDFFSEVIKYDECIVSNPLSEYNKTILDDEKIYDSSFCNRWIQYMVKTARDVKNSTINGSPTEELRSNEGMNVVIKAIQSFNYDKYGWKNEKNITRRLQKQSQEIALTSEVYLAKKAYKRLDECDRFYSDPEIADMNSRDVAEIKQNLHEICDIKSDPNSFLLDHALVDHHVKKIIENNRLKVKKNNTLARDARIILTNFDAGYNVEDDLKKYEKDKNILTKKVKYSEMDLYTSKGIFK